MALPQTSWSKSWCSSTRHVKAGRMPHSFQATDNDGKRHSLHGSKVATKPIPFASSSNPTSASNRSASATSTTGCGPGIDTGAGATSINTLTSTTAAAARLHRSLQGPWQVQRRIDSRGSDGAPSGTVSATAAFLATGAPGEVLYREQGQFVTDQGVTLRMSRSYIFVHEPGGETLEVFFVRGQSERDYHFMSLKLSVETTLEVCSKPGGTAYGEGSDQQAERGQELLDGIGQATEGSRASSAGSQTSAPRPASPATEAAASGTTAWKSQLQTSTTLQPLADSSPPSAVDRADRLLMLQGTGVHLCDRDIHQGTFRFGLDSSGALQELVMDFNVVGPETKYVTKATYTRQGCRLTAR